MMECLPKTIAFEKRGHVAIFTIDRPDALNAFTREMLVGMDAGFAEFQADADLWVAILTGAGASLASPLFRRKLMHVAAWCVILTGGITIARGCGFLSLPGQTTPASCPFCHPAGESH